MSTVCVCVCVWCLAGDNGTLNVMQHAVQARAKAAGEEYKMPPDDDATVDAIINLVNSTHTLHAASVTHTSGGHAMVVQPG